MDIVGWMLAGAAVGIAGAIGVVVALAVRHYLTHGSLLP